MRIANEHIDQTRWNAIIAELAQRLEEDPDGVDANWGVRFHNCTFKGVIMELDSKEFLRCVFHTCTVTDFGLCDLTDCFFATDCNVTWGDVPFSNRDAYGVGVFVALHDDRVIVKAGCFCGDYDKFVKRVDAVYGDLYWVTLDHVGYKSSQRMNANDYDIERYKHLDYVVKHLDPQKRPLGVVYKGIVDTLVDSLRKRVL